MDGKYHNGDKALIFAMGISFFTDAARFADRCYYACQIIHALHVKDGVIVDFLAQPKVEKEVTEQGDKLCWVVEEGLVGVLNHTFKPFFLCLRLTV